MISIISLYLYVYRFIVSIICDIISSVVVRKWKNAKTLPTVANEIAYDMIYDCRNDPERWTDLIFHLPTLPYLTIVIGRFSTV